MLIWQSFMASGETFLEVKSNLALRRKLSLWLKYKRGESPPFVPFLFSFSVLWCFFPLSHTIHLSLSFSLRLGFYCKVQGESWNKHINLLYRTITGPNSLLGWNWGKSVILQLKETGTETFWMDTGGTFVRKDPVPTRLLVPTASVPLSFVYNWNFWQ